MNRHEQVAEIWAAYHEQARAFVGRRAGAEVDLEALADAMGAAAEILTRSIAGGTEIRNPAAWLGTIAWREYVALTRAGEPRQRELWRHDALEAGAERHSDEIPAAIARRESADQLERALDRAVGRLTPHQRANCGRRRVC